MEKLITICPSLVEVQEISAREGGTGCQQAKVEVLCSYMQMYNEEATDLLSGDTNAKLLVREGKDGPFVQDLTEHPVLNGMTQETPERFKRSICLVPLCSV